VGCGQYAYFYCAHRNTARGEPMKKSELIAAIQKEILRHDFGTFVENPPSVAQGGHGMVVPGCTTCNKRANTMPQFLEHIARDAIPQLIERLSQGKE